MHYLVHLVDDMKTLGSFGILLKNLPLSLSKKHQLYTGNKMIDINDRPTANFIYSGDEIGEGNITCDMFKFHSPWKNLCSIWLDRDIPCL